MLIFGTLLDPSGAPLGSKEASRWAAIIDAVCAFRISWGPTLTEGMLANLILNSMTRSTAVPPKLMPVQMPELEPIILSDYDMYLA